MSLKGKLRCVGLTDTGKVREHNEDTIAYDGDMGLLVLADGMGGYNAGEVASGIAVKTIFNLVREAVEREDLTIPDKATGLSRPSIILRDAIHRANKIIYQTARTQPQCEGMGTTVVGALFFDNRISIAHVGDSRLYRVRNGKLDQVTLDHSLLQELVDRGFYSPEEAQRAANKNYVTRALGRGAGGGGRGAGAAREQGRLLRAVLRRAVGHGRRRRHSAHRSAPSVTNLEAVAKHLIQLANDNGGQDNVSVVMAQVLDSFPARTGLFDRILKWFS